MAVQAQTKAPPFRKVSEIEYEIQISGRTKTIKTPFALIEKLFMAFIHAGGQINEDTGMVENDILSLIRSFRNLGDILMAEYDDYGVVTTEGTCAGLSATDVVSLFLLAKELVESFVPVLTQLLMPQSQPEENVVEESPVKKETKKTTTSA